MPPRREGGQAEKEIYGRRATGKQDKEIGAKMTENNEKVRLPAPDCATLQGFAQIGLWLGISTGQARSRANAGLIPEHRPKGKNFVFAIKSEVNGHLRDLASKSREVAKDP